MEFLLSIADEQYVLFQSLILEQIFKITIYKTGTGS